MTYRVITNAELAHNILKLLEEQDCDVQMWSGPGADTPEMLNAIEGFFLKVMLANPIPTR